MGRRPGRPFPSPALVHPGRLRDELPSTALLASRRPPRERSSCTHAVIFTSESVGRDAGSAESHICFLWREATIARIAPRGGPTNACLRGLT